MLDYEKRWAELEGSANPFAVLVMAHLKTQATRHDLTDRLAWKLKLVKGLYQRGYNREDILELFRFIDWLMVLPEELEHGFEKAIIVYEEETNMTYVTSIERIGIKKGIEEGIEQGRQQGIIQATREGIQAILKARFGEIKEELVELIDKLDDPTTLKMLLEKAATVETSAEFEQLVARSLGLEHF